MSFWWRAALKHAADFCHLSLWATESSLLWSRHCLTLCLSVCVSHRHCLCLSISLFFVVLTWFIFFLSYCGIICRWGCSTQYSSVPSSCHNQDRDLAEFQAAETTKALQVLAISQTEDMTGMPQRPLALALWQMRQRLKSPCCQNTWALRPMVNSTLEVTLMH